MFKGKSIITCPNFVKYAEQSLPCSEIHRLLIVDGVLNYNTGRPFSLVTISRKLKVVRQ